ncbi:MAG: molybdenum cofactor biosynthesis protein MoaE [Gemmatimonadales bacterium]
MVHLTRTAINVAALTTATAGPADGGIATFIGLVRDHHDGREVLRLEYTAFEPMAEVEAERIVQEAEARWPVRIGLRHRLGTLEIGDIAVAVVAVSAHRGPAFDACRHVIEEVKRRVPIWKQESYADGTVGWVDPTAAGRGRENADRADPAAARGYG